MLKQYLSFVIVFTILFTVNTTYCQNTFETLYSHQQYGQLINHCRLQINNEPGNGMAHYYLALAQQSLFRFNNAANSFFKAFNLGYEPVSSVFLAALNFEKAGNTPRAEQLFLQLLNTDSTHIAARANLALLYKNNHEWVKAVDNFAWLANADSTNGYYYSQLAFCCSKAGISVPVIPYYIKAIELNPTDYESAKQLVNQCIDQKYYDYAISYTDTFLVSFKNDIYFLKQQALLSALTGNYLDAVRNFENVVALGDTSQFTCKYYGQSLYNNGNYEQATIWLGRYLNNKPDDAHQRIILGLACNYAYKYTDAINHFDMAYSQIFDKKLISRIDTERGNTYSRYADYIAFRDTTPAKKNELYNNALASYQSAINIYPQNYEVLKLIALLYEQKFKNQQLALYYYQKYYDTTPPGVFDELSLDWVQKKISTLKEELHFMGN